jgi:3-oxoacyl-[acyl-carrier protein] reductase
VEHDVRELDSWERLVAEVGPVEVLVNNAARTEMRSFWEIDVAEWDDVLATNLRGTYLGCRVVGARMRDRGRGRIVNIASVSGQGGRAATGTHYATSKAAIVALTRLAATELAASGVTVNAIAPAAIDSPLVHEFLTPDRIEAMVVERIPVGRLGRPEEVAAAVAYLASDAAAFVTGATLDVNGGMLMR